jgi:hypothetical protein
MKNALIVQRTAQSHGMQLKIASSLLAFALCSVAFFSFCRTWLTYMVHVTANC